MSEPEKQSRFPNFDFIFKLNLRPSIKRLRPNVLRWTLILAVVLSLVGLATHMIPNPLPTVDLGPFAPWIGFIIVIIVTKVILNIVKYLFRLSLGTKIPSEADLYAVYEVVSYVIWIVVLIAAFWFVLGGSAVFAGITAGILAAAMIFVLQEPLLNIIGWAIIMTQRLFKLGDRIEVNGVRGYIVNIGTMNTTMREFGGWMSGDTLSGRYVYVPNRMVLSSVVYNYTRDSPFINDEIITEVTYESDFDKAEALILQAANELVGEMMRNNVDTIRRGYEFRDLRRHMVEEPTVRFRMADSSVTILLQYFCPAFRRRFYRSELTRRILELFQQEPSVTIAYPHLELVPYSHGHYEHRFSQGNPDGWKPDP